jgi:hypothetical protein
LSSEQTTNKPTVQVFVRLGAGDNESARTLSFFVPDGISQEELLDKDIAIDGNRALIGIGYDPNDSLFWGSLTGGSSSLGAALTTEEKALAAFLAKYGYSVKFT